MSLSSTPMPAPSDPPLRRIMVVDDDVDGARSLSRLLERAGYDVVLHHCGGDAIEAMRAGAVALVILDMDMPVMHGLECLRLIRADAALEGVPVIVYSADSTSERMTEARRLGAQEFIVKGMIEWADFLLVIERHLR